MTNCSSGSKQLLFNSQSGNGISSILSSTSLSSIASFDASVQPDRDIESTVNIANTVFTLGFIDYSK